MILSVTCLRGLQLLRCISLISAQRNSHDNGTFLSPDALGGVLRLHVSGDAVLQGACDVLLDNVGTVVSGGTGEMGGYV